MPVSGRSLSPPSIRILRWLVDPGPDVPEDVRGVLLLRMLSNPSAIVLGAINSILVNAVALGMKACIVFAGYMVADVLLATIRVGAIRRIEYALVHGGKTPVNTYLLSGIVWCALQGTVAVTAMWTGKATLELLAGITVFGIVGPICARNYPAPRYCMLLVMLCDLSFVVGCLLFSDRWLLVTLAQTPLFLVGTYEVIRTFQSIAIATLRAATESRHRATHDPLTGLLNRRGFQDVVAQHVGTNTRRLGVLALDLDGFKAVNDLLGHHVGDALLEAVAIRLSARVRPADTVVRLGGDEFVVLLDGVTFAEARDCAERLIEEIGHVPYQINGAPAVRVGVSIGIACAPEDGVDIERLHRCADLALYEAKTAGRGVWRRSMRSAERTAASD